MKHAGVGNESCKAAAEKTHSGNKEIGHCHVIL